MSKYAIFAALFVFLIFCGCTRSASKAPTATIQIPTSVYQTLTALVPTPSKTPTLTPTPTLTSTPSPKYQIYLPIIKR